LALSDHFELGFFRKKFDYLLALSVFTHLFANHIIRCLAEAREVLVPEGRFFATFFLAPHSVHLAPMVHQPGGVKTEYDRDPFPLFTGRNSSDGRAGQVICRNYWGLESPSRATDVDVFTITTIRPVRIL
jgi:ubiquinone/menaquinone biosynthesis C-methylase UbiE